MRVVFMGSPDFAVPALGALVDQHTVELVVTQPDKPAGRGRKLAPPPVKLVAEQAGVTVCQPRSARTGELLERIQQTNADIGVVVAYGKILPVSVLDAFPHGCLNIHASVLPAYRGAAPIQRSIMAGDTTTGVSLMALDEGMDTGPVYDIAHEAIHDDDTTATLATRLSELGARLLLDTLAKIAAGAAKATPQDDSRATYAPMLQKAEGAIEWTRPARLVSAHIRGVDPWPGAFTTLGDDHIKMYRPIVLDTAHGEPGTVLEVSGAGLVVGCGSGACRIGEVQAPGKKRMAAGDFARGRRLEVGARFGEPPA